jgi:hypothetical protein
MADATPSHEVMTCSTPPAFSALWKNGERSAVSEAVKLLGYRWSSAPVAEVSGGRIRVG